MYIGQNSNSCAILTTCMTSTGFYILVLSLFTEAGRTVLALGLMKTFNRCYSPYVLLCATCTANYLQSSNKTMIVMWLLTLYTLLHYVAQYVRYGNAPINDMPHLPSLVGGGANSGDLTALLSNAQPLGT